MQDVLDAVRVTIRDATSRLTLLDIEKRLSRHCQIDRKAVRSTIRELVRQRELIYVSDFGHTFIETSYHKPVRITASIVLKPWDCKAEQDAGDIVVSLIHGTSFGSGQHATTRLCLRGLECLLQKETGPWPGKGSRVLDIGTGSGVLIITAVQMGIGSGIGLDVDSCAISEARANVACNGLSERINISRKPFEIIEEPFDLILANLRLPTLKTYLPRMVERINSKGRLLISGLKRDECDFFIEHSQQFDLRQIWMEEERGWAAVGFHKET